MMWRGSRPNFSALAFDIRNKSASGCTQRLPPLTNFILGVTSSEILAQSMMYRPAQCRGYPCGSAAPFSGPHIEIFTMVVQDMQLCHIREDPVLSDRELKASSSQLFPKSSTDFDELACSFVARFVLWCSAVTEVGSFKSGRS